MRCRHRFPDGIDISNGRNSGPDFHNDLAAEIRARLNRLIQPRHDAARLAPYVTYEVVEIGQVRGVRPDAGVWQSQPPRGETAAGTATITPAPVQSRVPLEVPLHLDRVEIRAVSVQQLVTVIEICLR